MVNKKKPKSRLEKFKHFLKIVGKIILCIFLFIISFIFLLFVINSIFLSIENKNIPVIGHRVEVYKNEYMNIYETGSGKHTIVLLSGWGTTDPVVDFKKLADNLGKDYKVAVVEYFGYGFSDKTDKPRTNENMVNETRIALKKSGIDGPYILMPHSISGLYAMYWAHKYPAEAEGVIGLETAFADIVNYIGPEYYQMSHLNSLFYKLGIPRFFINVLPSWFGYSDSVSDLDKKYTDTAKYLICKNVMNDTVINEVHSEYQNMLDIKGYQYPNNLPVLTVLAQSSIDSSRKLLNTEDWPAPKDEVQFHEELFTNKNIQTIKVLNGDHYIFHNNTDNLSKLVKDFISNNYSK